jgi:2'-5' RNA ligase
MHRLFFALWPDAPVRRRIESAANALEAGVDGRPIDPERYHLTLQFLGDFPVLPDWLPGALRAARSVNAAAFPLDIDVVGGFPASRVGWLGASTSPAGLLSLRSALRQALDANGVPLRPEPSFQPHITIRRNARAMPSDAIAPIGWNVDGFVLIDSQAGRTPAYAVIGQWPLVAA